LKFYYFWLSDAAVTLARPLHMSKDGQSKQKGKTKRATLISDFHAHGSRSSLWPISLAWSWNSEAWRSRRLDVTILPKVRGSIPHWWCANTTGLHTLHWVSQRFGDNKI